MTETERKALALVNEVKAEYPLIASEVASNLALCRAIEQHEAFRQEVSGAVEAAKRVYGGHRKAFDQLDRFILPKPKPDPLVEALEAALWDVSNVKLTQRELTTIANTIREKRDAD